MGLFDRLGRDLVGIVPDFSFSMLAPPDLHFDRLRAHPALAKPVFSIPDEPLRGFFKAILVDGLTVP